MLLLWITTLLSSPATLALDVLEFQVWPYVVEVRSHRASVQLVDVQVEGMLDWADDRSVGPYSGRLQASRKACFARRWPGSFSLRSTS
jgi:hypothetical protein